MSPGRGQLHLFGGSRVGTSELAASPFDFERAGLLEQAHDSGAGFLPRDRAFLSLTLRSLQAGDKTTSKKYLEEWAALIENSGQEAANLASRRELLKGFRLLADEDYLGAFRQLRQVPRSFSIAQLQKHFSAYWIQAHGSALIQVLRASTPHTQDEELTFQNLASQFQKTGNLRRAFGALEPAEQKWLRSRWSSESLEEIFTVSELKNPDAFLADLLGLAAHWRGRGDTRQATVLLGMLEGDATKDVFSYEVPAEVRQNARSIKAGGPFAPGSSWTRNLETTLASLSFSDVSRGVQTGGAWIGIATLACSYFGRYVGALRPWAARGIYALSEPQVAALLLTTGGYTLYENAPRAGEAFRRLTGPGSASFDDFLTLSGYSLGALAVGLGTTSFILGGKGGINYGRMIRAKDARPWEAWKAGYKQGDAARRAVQDPEMWLNYASSTTLSANGRKWLEFGAKAVDTALVKGSIVYGGSRFAYGLSLYNSSENPQGSVGDLLLRFGMDVFPATTIHLYRRGRGDRDSHLGSARSQEINEAVKANPTYRESVIQRIESGLPSLTVNRQDILMTRIRHERPLVEKFKAQGESLTPLPPVSPTMFYAPARAASASQAPTPVLYSERAHQPSDPMALHKRLALLDLAGQRAIYQKGELSPRGALQAILDHPMARDRAVFPRDLGSGPLGKELRRMAEESTQRWAAGKPRPLEGIFFASKDLFPGPDGLMMAGTKTGRFTDHEGNPVIRDLMELGAIPLPVGMIAAANGGWGGNAGFGYIPHPTREGFDPAGSSSGTAHVVGRRDFLVNWGIGTDTGGSVIAPAGAVGLTGFVPPAGLLSTKNMIPFATFLDRVGLLSYHTQDALRVVQLVSRPVPSDPHMRAENPGQKFQAAPFAPRIVYLEELLNHEKFSDTARQTFLKQMAKLKTEGWEVTPLGKEWNFLSEIPYLIYPWDAYTDAAFSHTNPLQVNRFEPPRRTLDLNQLERLPFGAFSLKEGHYDWARGLSARFQELVREKLGCGVLVASPSCEAIPTALIQGGSAGDYLDLHDRVTMMKNRLPEMGQISIPLSGNRQTGMALSGSLPDLLHFLERPRLQAVPLTISPVVDAPAVSPEHPPVAPVIESIVVPISSVRLRASRSRQGSQAGL